MKTLNIKTLVTSAVLATAMTIAASPASAYNSYGDCVAATWDPIGCGLIELFGVANIQAPGDLKVGKEDQARIKEMMEHGAFKSLEGGKARDSKLHGSTLQRTCKMGDLLAKFEKGAKPEELAKACYKRVK